LPAAGGSKKFEEYSAAEQTLPTDAIVVAPFFSLNMFSMFEHLKLRCRQMVESQNVEQIFTPPT